MLNCFVESSSHLSFNAKSVGCNVLSLCWSSPKCPWIERMLQCSIVIWGWISVEKFEDEVFTGDVAGTEAKPSASSGGSRDRTGRMPAVCCLRWEMYSKRLIVAYCERWPLQAWGRPSTYLSLKWENRPSHLHSVESFNWVKISSFFDSSPWCQIWIVRCAFR